jgi:SAM-dependent methyltransferase
MTDQDPQPGAAAPGWEEANAETAAAGWEANADWTDERLRPVTDWLIERSGVQAGDIVLDLAAGPGGVGHRAAELVGPQGRVLSTDLAPAMVEAAKRIGLRRGLSNVEYRVMDAQAMDLDDDAVDVILCRSGFMLMPHPAEALREARRVLRKGGNLAFSVFAAPEHNPFVGVPPSVFIELGHLPPPPPSAPGVFAMSDSSRIRELLVEAGFQVHAIEALDLEGPFTNEEVIVDRISEVNAQVGPVYRSLDDDEQAAARRALIDRFRTFRRADGTVVLPTQMWGVHAH